MSGAEFLPSSTLGGRVVGFGAGPGLRLTLSNMSVTEAERVVAGIRVDDWLEGPLSVSSTVSKSADFGRCFLLERKSMAFDNILKGFLLPNRGDNLAAKPLLGFSSTPGSSLPLGSGRAMLGSEPARNLAPSKGGVNLREAWLELEEAPGLYLAIKLGL